MGFESILGAVAGPVIGGLLGGSEDAPQQTSTQALDPRIAKYIYGDDSNRGILPAATDWFNKNSGGLNQQMIDGLTRQYNVYSDPQTAQGYTNQQALGQALLGGGIAGNPFTSGQMNLGGNQVNPAMSSIRQNPVQQPVFQNPAMAQPAQQNPFIYAPPAPPPAPAPIAAPAPAPFQWFDTGGNDGQR